MQRGPDEESPRDGERNPSHEQSHRAAWVTTLRSSDYGRGFTRRDIVQFVRDLDRTWLAVFNRDVIPSTMHWHPGGARQSAECCARSHREASPNGPPLRTATSCGERLA